MPPPREYPYLKVALELVDSVRDLAKEMRLLTESVDDLYHEIQWAVRNDRFRNGESWVPTQDTQAAPAEQLHEEPSPAIHVASADAPSVNEPNADDTLWPIQGMTDPPKKRRSRR